MRYADYLNRSMDRLTSENWERLLLAPETPKPIHSSIHAFCPCCRAALNLAMAVSLSPLPSVSNSADETLVDLAAVTDADIAVRAVLLAV